MGGDLGTRGTEGLAGPSVPHAYALTPSGLVCALHLLFHCPKGALDDATVSSCPFCAQANTSRHDGTHQRRIT
eukprot:364447-Chlamydomonas_euryale.AAC.19